MLVPLSWLKDYVPLPADPGFLVERLTIAGLESSGVRVFGLPVPPTLRVKPEDAGLAWERDKLLVAQVLKIEKHPDADKLKLVTLDYGAKEPKTVVTGAPNIAPGQSGMKVILGLRGSRYYFTGKDNKKTVMTLEPKELRGIPNDAMCMSNFELGISDEHEGIIILDDSDPPPGTPLQDLLGEIVVELDILPNMARCLSMIGIAREVAALTGAQTHVPETKLVTRKEEVDGKVSVEITDPKLCSRYTAMVICNVTIGPAPRWMRSRLHYAGMRPINNAVDITNYVMLEHGQPLHAFDYDILVKRAGGKPPTITVRPAKAGEKLKTLDGQDRTLSPENLVIADTAGAIALAGVMGGAETEVSAATKNILLESACFDFVSVRKTSRQFNLFSEASTRFSRGVHPEQAKPAAERAGQLFHAHAGGEPLAGIVDAYPLKLEPQVIDLDLAEIRRVLGFDIPAAEVARVLKALQFQVEPDGDDAWTVTTPQTRLDVQGSADLIEELARVYGYDKLPERLLPLELPEPKGNRALELEDRVRDLLADQGLQETITYSLTSAEVEAKLTPGGASQPGEFVTLLNPISPERSVLRRSLLPGVLQVAKLNLENTDSVSLYELGFVYIPKAKERLPDEPRSLAIVLCGRRTSAAWDDPLGVAPAQYDFYDIKGIVESLVGDLHLANVTFAAAQGVPWLHPMRAAELRVGGSAVGRFGELHPKVAAAFAATPVARLLNPERSVGETLSFIRELLEKGKSAEPEDRLKLADRLQEHTAEELRQIRGEAFPQRNNAQIELAKKIAQAAQRAVSEPRSEPVFLVAELDLEPLLALVPERYGYKPFSTFPPAKRDIAIVVPNDTPAEAVLAEIRAAGGDLLTDAALFDVYRGAGLPDGTKSLAFALTYQALDRTLGEKEIAKAHEKVEGRLRHVLKAQIRGKDIT